MKVLGERKELSADLQAVFEATGQDGCIEGRVLVDLCMQRSGQRGCGCDAPNASEEPLVPMTTSLHPPTLPVAQVRQYSYHPCAKTNVHDIRREFVGANRQNNSILSVLSQQAPLVAKVHLLDVVRKVGRSERSRGKQPKDFVFKALHQSCEKTMTSLWLYRLKSEKDNQQYSVMLDDTECKNSEIVHLSPYENDILLRPHPGHTGNYTPVPGRRVGNTQMEESRRLVEIYPGTYADVYKSTRE